MQRRNVLAGIGTAALASIAGCLGTVGLDEHEASPAGVDSDVRSETGYELVGVEEVGVEETVGAAGLSETVVVRNYLTECEKAVGVEPIGEQRAAVFTVLSTPQVGVAGWNVNPVEEMSTAELVSLVEDNYDDIDNISHEDDDEFSVLGQTTTHATFTADAVFDGVDLEVNLHVTEAVETDDDLLVTIGVYPREVELEEEENVRELIAAVTETLDDEDADEGTDDEGADDEDDGLLG
ncbi:DUF6517 family protein [Natrialbaceae archaeon AArc-T1-2]|uniref:DUF6517 family protein n=1 Tax=Natrialbaceae archaeon AArc-T1-2 TaxID=3053904 RepID=UPI00255AA46F|nr:DUF6517 family protein [Natrialbaceae archaeon AArc-T1-2]WIV66633.1 DUF6517 family protein [Natrialbaceae archaeon AArc-T1-2]